MVLPLVILAKCELETLKSQHDLLDYSPMLSQFRGYYYVKHLRTIAIRVISVLLIVLMFLAVCIWWMLFKKDKHRANVTKYETQIE